MGPAVLPGPLEGPDALRRRGTRERASAASGAAPASPAGPALVALRLKVAPLADLGADSDTSVAGLGQRHRLATVQEQNSTQHSRAAERVFAMDAEYLNTGASSI